MLASHWTENDHGTRDAIRCGQRENGQSLRGSHGGSSGHGGARFQAWQFQRDTLHKASARTCRTSGDAIEPMARRAQASQRRIMCQRGTHADGMRYIRPCAYARVNPYGCGCGARFPNAKVWGHHLSICATFASIAEGTIFDCIPRGVSHDCTPCNEGIKT